jgi:hypothetical protein
MEMPRGLSHSFHDVVRAATKTLNPAGTRAFDELVVFREGSCAENYLVYAFRSSETFDLIFKDGPTQDLPKQFPGKPGGSVARQQQYTGIHLFILRRLIFYIAYSVMKMP